jgi:DNA-directed RNA polymerase subunit RPC12/RpoP
MLEELEKKAQDIIESGGQFEYLSRQVNKFIMFKENSGDVMSVAYRCPQCSHEEQSDLELSKPYTLVCSSCGFLIFKQEKVKGKRKPRKKKTE